MRERTRRWLRLREVSLEMEKTRSQERWTVAESAGLSYQVTCSMSRILCVYEAETANSQVLPCNTCSALFHCQSAHFCQLLQY